MDHLAGGDHVVVLEVVEARQQPQKQMSPPQSQALKNLKNQQVIKEEVQRQIRLKEGLAKIIEDIMERRVVKIKTEVVKAPWCQKLPQRNLQRLKLRLDQLFRCVEFSVKYYYLVCGRNEE